MLDNQEIYTHIPKRIINWSQRDVAHWFTINQIDLPKEIVLTGRQFMQLTANILLNEFGLSMFLIRKVIDWIQFQADAFDEYVTEMEKLKKQTNKPQLVDKNYQEVYQQSNEMPILQRESLLSSCGTDNIISARQKHPTNIIMVDKVNSDDNLSFRSDGHSEGNSSQDQQQNVAQSHEVDNKLSESEQLWSSIEQANHNNVYKPIKYGKWRGSSSQENQPNTKVQTNQHLCQYFQSLSESYPIRVKFISNPHQGNPLLINHLVGNNGSQHNQDIQTNKNIPQQDHQSSYPNNINSNQITSINDPLTFPSEQSNVKLVTSQLLMGNGSILTVFYEDTLYQITKNTKIGRSLQNNIILKSDGVSRNHAEVIIQQQQDSKGNIQKRCYLRDIGSKYGTFIETDPQKPKKVALNEQYCIGQTIIRIDKLKLYKNKEKFDLSITIIQLTKEQRSFQNKSFITIGCRKRDSLPKDQKSSQTTKRTTKDKRDLELQDNYVKNYHCRFVIISTEVYLQQVEGNIFQKLQQNVKYPLNKIQSEVKFGDENVTFRMQQLFKTVQLND